MRLCKLIIRKQQQQQQQQQKTVKETENVEWLEIIQRSLNFFLDNTLHLKSSFL